MSRRVLINAMRCTSSAQRRAFATEVPRTQPSKPQSVPNLGATNTSTERDEIPVEMMSFQQRLTRTPEDRALLRKTLIRMAQLLVFSMVFNGAHMCGAFDPILKRFNRSEKPMDELELEDEDIVHRIGLL